MRGAALLLALAAGLPAPVNAVPSFATAGAAGSCGDVLPPEDPGPSLRKLEPGDLVRLRDIGPVDPSTFAAPFLAISPDGRRVAFQLRRADPEANAHCLAMVVLDLAAPASPKIVDLGGEPLLVTFDFRGIADFPTGLMRPVTPRWSPDGRWFAFLKRHEGRTQVWRAFADGSGSAPLTASEIDVVDFDVSEDGSFLVFATRPELERQRRAIERDGLSGWRYDDRFVPFLSKRPLATAPAPREAHVLDLATRRVRAATTAEALLVARNRETIAVAGAAAAMDSNGLEIGATNLSGGARRGSFRAARPSGDKVCSAEACDGAFNPWWMPGKSRARFFRREGWARASTAIYEWELASGRVRRLMVTEDVLASCVPSGASLLCLTESSLVPRRLVRLDPASGKRELLFDPNPEFRSLALGEVERLRWRNAFGIETLADLVLPVGYRKGTRYPLIVVQYDTRGFLRGGTGDEYPVQAFANRGYAVLSFRRPEFLSEREAPSDFKEAGRLDLLGFADRRSVHSSLEIGVRLLVERGIAAPGRIGITGLSDGASTVEWALLHSKLFAAAAVSSCCMDTTFVSLVGPAAARHFAGEGYPGILGRGDAFWKEKSLTANARRISAPILVQAAEAEVLNALEVYTGLREAGVPIDMFVYPDEFHSRWQPAHRHATYRRALDWFDYWLRDIRSAVPDRQAELRAWDRLKEEAAMPASGDKRPG